MGKIEMGEEDDTVNSETTSALGGTREVLNEVDCPGELMNEFRGHRGQVYPEVEEKQAGWMSKIRVGHVVGQWAHLPDHSWGRSKLLVRPETMQKSAKR